ncbi:MAG: sigma-70 family RNA polymerase sigma factor [Polyangiaceae bacterium]|nr:sigma-70 family RNA polymerase sigma factor [Polyangiaceae bacterium]
MSTFGLVGDQLPSKSPANQQVDQAELENKTVHQDSGVWALSRLVDEECTDQNSGLDAPAGDVASKVEPEPQKVEVSPRTRQEDQEVFRRYGPMVRRISMKAVRSLPRTITSDDITSAGWVGMSEAMRRRPAGMPEEQFEAYASYRIRGAILDYLRVLDPLSRRLRGIARELQAATRALTLRLGRAPQQDEIAREAGMSIQQYQKAVMDIQESGMDRLDAGYAIEATSSAPSPEALASHSEIISTVGVFSKKLPERLQLVLNLHYEHECSLREIGEILGVTESRVCQLHAEAVQRIKAQFDGKSPNSVRRRRRSANCKSH